MNFITNVLKINHSLLLIVFILNLLMICDTSIVKASSESNSAQTVELRGPNIKGFQLGQTKSTAEENFKRLGYQFETILAKDYFGLLPAKAIVLKSTNGLEIVILDNVIRRIEILDSGLTNIFNAKGSRKGFLQAFVNNYNIPQLIGNTEMKQNILNGSYFTVTNYTYQDDTTGWSIICSTLNDNIEVTNIKIESIQKVENFNF